jgi:hypothetical protein
MVNLIKYRMHSHDNFMLIENLWCLKVDFYDARMSVSLRDSGSFDPKNIQFTKANPSLIA